MRAGSLVILAILGVLPGGAHANPEVRDELLRSLTNMICVEQPSVELRSAWNQGIFSSQMKIELVDLTERNDLTDEKLLRRAELMAKAHHYRGYAMGSCSERLKWLAFTPAAAPLTIADQRIHLPIKSLNKYCKAIEVSSVGLNATKIEQHRVPTDGVIDLPHGSGTLSVTCSPKEPKWLGRQTWYIAPFGDLAQNDVPIPGLEILERFGKQPELALHLWIEAIRKKARLEPKLIQTQMMTDAATKLAVGGSISHDRGALKFVKNQLGEGGVTFLGENRVSAENLQQAAWLLWYSPMHRELLLQEKANTIGLSVHQPQINRQSSIFAVITMGEMKQIDVAKKTDAKGKVR